MSATSLLIVLPAFAAGFVQGITGFGSAIILMVFLPGLVGDIPHAAATASLIMALPNVSMVWRYRKHLQWRAIPLPFTVYIGVATWALSLSLVLEVAVLKMLLGALLLALATYFLWLKPSATHYAWPVVLAFMAISGFFNGLFSIGGPLVALYYLTQATTKETYLANLQSFFFMDLIMITGLRVAHGVLTLALLPLAALGCFGALVGTAVANRLVTRLNTQQVKQFVYAFIGFAGVYYSLSAWLH